MKITKKHRTIAFAAIVLLTSNGLSYLAGQNSQGKTVEPLSIAVEKLVPSQKQIKSVCAQAYTSDMASEQLKVLVTSVQGTYRDIDSSFLCASQSNHLIKSDGRLLQKTNQKDFFELKREYVVKPISESDFEDKMKAQL